MESPGSDSSGDSSTSSSSADTTSADSYPVQTAYQPDDKSSPMDFDHDDSASDVSMPLETDDEDEELYGGTTLHPQLHEVDSTPSAIASHTEIERSKKRKLSSSSETSKGQFEGEAFHEDRKRQRSIGDAKFQKNSIPWDRSLLPGEIWHQIFAFCPPRVLGTLLRVNKSFNAYLDSSKFGSIIAPLPQYALKALSANAIWAASRRLFPLPGMQIMPAPLHGKSELDMWKIACGSLCQFCSKKADTAYITPIDKWRPGPGEYGVTPIFPLGLRSCGICLQQQLTKEIDLMISLPSPLMAALPFVFMTNELHIIPISTFQSGQHPSAIQITKYYPKVQIDEIRKEFEDVKILGAATAEEWLKGLEGRGKQYMDDSNRWERWEAAGGLMKMRNTRTVESSATSSSTTSLAPSVNGRGHNAYNGISSLPQPLHILTNAASHLPQPVFSTFATNPPPRFDSPAQNGFSSFLPRPHLQAKHERTKEEVAELKAARRAEIERRCLLLSPPLTAGVLAHMASFQAAIQIIQPLTESAWEVLKPRLLSQREEAEQRENDRIAQTRVVQERFDERRQQDLQAKGDPKDLVDLWDDIQAPLRARIGGYADEIIRDGWNNGDKVSSENSPRFAAEVLVYVRKRFYAEVAKDEAAVRATGREPEVDPPNGPFTRRLTLENMKWVFDTKVKPLTEQYRKELFLCNACDYASKYYGFEGVVQHFAAKHTSALSAGPVVVHWKSEWPEYPPFNPDPAATSVNSYYPAASSAGTSHPASVGQAIPQTFGYAGCQAIPPVYTPNPHVYQESPGPYYGHPQFGDQYAANQNGPYQPPPQPYPDTSQSYHAPHYSMPPVTPVIPGFNDTTHQYNQQNFDGNYQAQPQSMYTSPHGATAYPATASDVPAQHPGYAQPGAFYNTSYNQSTAYPPNSFPQAPQRTGEYTAQLLDLARNAREVWNSIGGLKEIPGSVKVYTIIYHILARFRDTFQDDPPLSMLVEGLSNNKDMRPVRNVNGLLCKACSLGMAGSISSAQKKHFSFPQLVNHFHSLHEQRVSQSNIGHLPDWTKDMVQLPDRSKLTSIVNAPGMDDQKLRLFIDALPDIVPVDEPTSTKISNGSSHHFGNTPDLGEYSHLAPSQDNHEKYYTSLDSGKPSEAGSVAYGAGEYDPRHPAELSAPIQPQRKASHQYEQQSDISNRQAPDRYSKQEDQNYHESSHNRSSRHYIEESSPRPIVADGYGLAPLGEGRRVYIDEHVRYRDDPEVVDYRARRDPHIQDYHEADRLPSNYRFSDNMSRQAHSKEVQLVSTQRYVDQEQYPRQANDAALQQNKIFEVVAQISQHAQQAQERLPVQVDAGEAGSEDGEVRLGSVSNQESGHKPVSDEAGDAAERFLNEFRPGEVADNVIRKPRGMDYGSRSTWECSRPNSRPAQRQAEHPHRRMREVYDDERRTFARDPRHEIQDGYLIQEHTAPPRQSRDYAYDDRYDTLVEEPPVVRDRSPELVDQRFKLDNAVYREDRQNSHGTHRTPSRYARYESARLENDRARSRSPVYVKMGPQSGPYRERTPVAHPLRSEPIYRSQTPLQHVEEAAYERPRRQEYVRVYPQEQRPREPQYSEAFEFVRVSDPQGDYMIRRPVRREVEPVYANYEDEVYTRPPVYESRAPLPRGEPAFLEGEEYDPRHPAPPPAPIRYQ